MFSKISNCEIELKGKRICPGSKVQGTTNYTLGCPEWQEEWKSNAGRTFVDESTKSKFRRVKKDKNQASVMLGDYHEPNPRSL